ncbi:hypothetical protein IFT69_18315 [Pseudomonas putida]|nr:hypothetical protein [Pseudomonas putida]
MNIQEALAQKNLTVMDGARRLAILAEHGGIVVLRDEKGKNWHLTVENGLAVIVDAIADPELADFKPLWVEIGRRAPFNSPESLRKNPENIRAARQEDDSPSP